jgi:hypothetical protein
MVIYKKVINYTCENEKKKNVFLSFRSSYGERRGHTDDGCVLPPKIEIMYVYCCYIFIIITPTRVYMWNLLRRRWFTEHKKKTPLHRRLHPTHTRVIRFYQKKKKKRACPGRRRSVTIYQRLGLFREGKYRRTRSGGESNKNETEKCGRRGATCGKKMNRWPGNRAR